MFRATASRVGWAPNEGQVYETADMAARQLFVLLRAHGWTDSEESTLEVLRSGEPLVFQRFEYKVTEEPG